MARKSRTSSPRSKSASSSSAGRSTSSRRSSGRSAAAAVEQADDDGIGIEGAVGIATTITLLAALVMLDMYMSRELGKGVFF